MYHKDVAAPPRSPTARNLRGEALHPAKLARGRIAALPPTDLERELTQILWMKLERHGYAPARGRAGFPPALAQELRSSTLSRTHEIARVDERIQNAVNRFLAEAGHPIAFHLPARGNHLIMDREGLSTIASLPFDGITFQSKWLKSYRLVDRQGVLHNPRNSRRTTKGSFHICEGDFPIPADKIAVPPYVFAKMLQHAFSPPAEDLILPFTAKAKNPYKTLVSMHLRPALQPALPGISLLPDGFREYTERYIDVRYFAPASLISNLDFVEQIFGNAGYPYHRPSDAEFDPERWSGVSTCIILAPHICGATKKELGFKHFDQADAEEREKNHYYKDESELYNGGQPYKVTLRLRSGVVVTIIGDNYFGYSKKEIKTQLSFAANINGEGPEEHSGGARIYRRSNIGDNFDGSQVETPRTFADVVKLLKDSIVLHPSGYARCKKFPNLIYLPSNAIIDLETSSVCWRSAAQSIKYRLDFRATYIHPSGIKICTKKDRDGSWHLVATAANGIYYDKPSTVSGGGKSEVAKPFELSLQTGPVRIENLDDDLAMVAKVLSHDFSGRFRDERPTKNRPILGRERTLGSVIKLLTPAAEYTTQYNRWLNNIPSHIREMVIIVKELWRPSMGEWQKCFSAPGFNGEKGRELHFNGRKLMARYVRVGFDEKGEPRLFSLRLDVEAAEKVQELDDITGTVIVPRRLVKDLVASDRIAPAYKFNKNPEYRLFQRPDDAIHPGYDVPTEEQYGASHGLFLSNSRAIEIAETRDLVEDRLKFDKYTAPMQERIIRAARCDGQEGFLAISSEPVIDADGQLSKNQRFLEKMRRGDYEFRAHIAEIGERLSRKIGIDKPVLFPTTDVLTGHRLNPPDRKLGIPPLCVYNPIHYRETPEAFIDLISSLTGKSPSTFATQVESEGALTKGPFNCLLPIHDLNDRFVTHLLTQESIFVTAAGYIGPYIRVDHDISLLVAEIWARMKPEERDPRFLIKAGHLVKMQDFKFKGETLLASRLGYRIHNFDKFIARVYDRPNQVFTREMLQPELQSREIFAEGLRTITESQRVVAERYFQDGSINLACPPLKALLHIMRDGHYQGRTLHDPSLRKFFTLQTMLRAEWYRGARLRTLHERQLSHWRSGVESIQTYLQGPDVISDEDRKMLMRRLLRARQTLTRLEKSSPKKIYLYTIGADPGILRDG